MIINNIRKQSKKHGTVIIAIIIIALLAVTTTTPTLVLAQEIFESEEDNFRLQIPAGWVIEDFDNITYEGYSEVDIAILCPASEALPGIGGEYNCQAANITDVIAISSLPDLQSIPEFQ